MSNPGLPYGSWPSPVTIEEVLSGGATMSELTADGADLLWLESLPAQDGRVTLRRLREGRLEELTPFPISVRARVNEYGGGAYASREGVLVWVDDATSAVWLRVPGQPDRRLTQPGTGCRYADLRVHPGRGIALAVRESPRTPQQQAADPSRADEPETTIVALALDRAAATSEWVLCSGADFYANPELSADGRLAWVQWNHPDMPWEASTVLVGRLVDQGVVEVQEVAGGRREGSAVSAQHPSWRSDGDLLLFSDQSGWWTPQLWGPKGLTALSELHQDFDKPMWVLGNHAVADLGSRLLVSHLDEGVARLALLDPAGGALVSLAALAEVSAVASLRGVGHAIVQRVNEGPALVRVEDDGALSVLHRCTGPLPDPETTSVPRSLLVSGDLGPVQAWFYPPRNERVHSTGRAGERPPLLVKSHGGPTGMASSAWSAQVQFWTSRGFAVLDVNYSGSAGFGRAYRQRLSGRWGVAEVADCVAAVTAVLDAGLADPERVAITGGSAGGYTTLQALVTTRAFAAGVSSYGIGDLELLATDTHKFESRYLEGLIGPYPQCRERYLERSPIHHVDQLATPMLIMQGVDDRVVPPNQAEQMAAAIRAKGLPVALLMFPGEGHGFRRLETRRAALQAQVSFFAQLFGFTPADPVPTLAIENLPAAQRAPGQ